MHRSIAPVFACLAPLALATVTACGSTESPPSPATVTPATVPDDGPPTTPPAETKPAVDNGAPSTTYPAPHPPLPQLVNQAGGKVLATPKLHLVFFPGYEHAAELQELAQKIGPSPYWTAVASEYGVGAAEYAGSTELIGETAPANIADSAIEAYLNDKLTSGAFGTPDPNAIYTIVYPKSTTITSSDGPLGQGQSCSSFGGYHSDTAVAISGAAKKQNIAFAVLPTCPAFGGLGELDGLTGAASHEWVEAVTDPFPSTNRGADSAFGQVDSDHFIWLVLGGTEAGDLCVPESNAFYTPKDLPFTVQRSWSNKLAKAGHDPCAPNLPGAFFDSAPVLPDAVTMQLPASFGGSAVETRGVKIPMGASKTIEVDLFSDAPTSGPWTVSAVDTLAQLTKGAPTLDFQWDRTQGVNGEKLHLTITVKGASVLVPGSHPFMITSTLGTTKAAWPALVVE